jgi:hypothetical protein
MLSNRLEDQPAYISLAPQRGRIRELLKCPFDWNEVMPNLSVPNLLNQYWSEFVRDYQVAGEGEYIYDDLFCNGIDLEIELHREVLDSDIINIESWIERARDEYKECTRRFFDLKVADREIYPKHLVNKIATRPEIIEASRSGRSFFYSEISNEDLWDLVWNSIVCHCQRECDENCTGPWRKFLEVTEMKLYVECEHPIGASGGRETSVVRLIFDSSTPLVHAHPITEEEAGGRVIVPHKFPKTWKDSFISLHFD